MKKFQADKLEPKADKCVFIEYPKQLGIPPISDLEAKVIASRNESFLEEKFLSKELSGRMKLAPDKGKGTFFRSECE